MFYGLTIGVVDSSKGRGANSIDVTTVDGVATMIYIPLSGELNKKPIVDDLVISSDGPYAEDSTLTATLTGRTNGPFTAGTHQYQWYRLSSLSGGTLTSIAGATNSTYTLVAADVGTFIVCAGRYVQSAGGNANSDWFYSEPTVAISAGTGGDIVFSWEDFFDIESGASVPSNWNDAGVSPELVNLGSGEFWTATSTNKPTFSTDKLVFVKANSHKILKPSTVTHPPKFEVWIKAQFNETVGNLFSFGSNTLLGMNASTQYTVKGMANQTGNLSEHVFRIVFNGASSKFQVDNGSEVSFTETTSFSQYIVLGTTYTGGSPASFNLKRFQRTPYNTFLTPTQVTDKWAYHGF